MIDSDDQLFYWEGQSKRKHPSDPIVAAFVLPKIDFIVKYLQLTNHTLILDIGCGNGYFTYYLSKLGVTIGLDLAETMLRLNPGRLLVQASAFRIPFADSSFDLVFCSNLLHHLRYPVQAIQEMRRVSRRYIAISEPNRYNPAMLMLGLLKREERETLRYTRSRLEKLATHAGLKILANKTMGFVTPNRMPRFVANLLTGLDFPNPMGAYSVLVSERNNFV
jgi:SAM-dependent methyltransferase